MPADAADGPEPTDGGDAAEVAVLEGPVSVSPLSRRTMALAACRPPCMATSATPGRLLRLTMSPTAKTSGWPGRVRSGSTAMRPARSTSAPVASASAAASGEAWTPAAHTTVWASMRSVVPSASRRRRRRASTPVTRAPMRSSTPRRFELLGRPGRTGGRRTWPAAPCRRRASSTRTDAGSNVRKFVAAGCARPAHGSDRPARTPVGPAPTTTIVSHCALLGRVVGHLGHLEGPEDAPAQLEGVVDRLHARGVQGATRRGRSTTGRRRRRR